MNQRQKKIVELLNEKGQMSFSEIKNAFSDFSDMTLRNDLRMLDQNKLIVRVFGGARSIGKVLHNEEQIYSRMVKNKESKINIAEKAIKLIHENSSIFIDSGSTMIELSKIFPDIKSLVFTTGIHNVIEISKLNNPRLFVVGGELNTPTMTIAGAQTCKILSSYHFDFAFIGTSGYNENYGFNCGESEECEVKKLAIKHAESSVVLMDSSKVGLSNTFSFANLDDIDIVISDDNLNKSTKKQFASKGILVI